MDDVTTAVAVYRAKLARAISRFLLPHHFTIISDDCWGGQLYRQIGIPYATPTVGLAIGGDDFFRFLRNLRAKDATSIEFDSQSHSYPVGRTPYAEIHFHHYPTSQSAADAFVRRYKRINWDMIVYKIDLEKDYHTDDHVREWNALQLPGGVALYSKRVAARWKGRVHHGVYIDDWTSDGAALFNKSRGKYNIFKWVRSGKVENSALFRLANRLLLDFDAARPSRASD